MAAYRWLSLKAKIIIALLFFGMMPAFWVSWLTIRSLTSEMENTQRQILRILAQSKGSQIETLFENMSSQIQELGASPYLVEAFDELSEGFEKHAKDTKAVPLEKVKKSLEGYYLNEFGKEFEKRNSGNTASEVSNILNSLSETTLRIQYSFISNNSNPLGSKDNLEDPQDSSKYAQAHKEFHPYLRTFLKKFEYYDIFLVDSKTGDIVYTVFKELDFATNLTSGPYAKTGLGKVFSSLRFSKDPSAVAISDMEPYFPSYNDGAMFIGVPIKNGSGVLIIQIPVVKIDQIIAKDGNWTAQGYGTAASAVIVAQDGTSRSNSRTFIEDPKSVSEFKDMLKLTDQEVGLINSKKTTAMKERIDLSIWDEAKSKDVEHFHRYVNHFGQDVFGSRRNLKLPGGLNWTFLVEAKAKEAMNLDAINRVLSYILAIAASIILVFAWLFARILSTNIIRIISELEHSVVATKEHSKSLKSTATQVSSAATEQASAIQETVATLDEISAMVNKSVDYAKQSADRSQQSQRVATEGKKAVSEMIRAMDEIKDSNDQIMSAIDKSNSDIGGLVKVIQEIASKTNIINDIVFQTKLLSFNASVEAARAGEHGKGFAVVAEEVGHLAQMSGNAAREIRQMLADSVQKVETVVKETGSSIHSLVDMGRSKIETGADVAKRCGEVLDEVVENVSSVASMMNEVSQANQEQAQGISNITTAMNELDEVTHINSSTASKTTELADTLSDQAAELDDSVRHLTSEIFGQGSKRPLNPNDANPSAHDRDEKVISIAAKAKDRSSKTKTSPRASGSGEKNMGPSSNKSSASTKKVSGLALGEEIPSSDDPRFEEV